MTPDLPRKRLTGIRRLLRRSGRSGRLPSMPAALFVRSIGMSDLHTLLTGEGYQLEASATLHQRCDDAVTVRVTWRKQPSGALNVRHVAKGTLPARLVLGLLEGVHAARPAARTTQSVR